MKMLCCLICLALFPVLSDAIPPQKREHFNTKDGAVYPKGYLYPSFQDGRIYLEDGTQGVAKMNFNRFTKEMLFISPQKDTLRLLHPEATVMITIVSDTFHFLKNTFLKKITHHQNAPNLFLNQELKYVTTERPVPYGYSATTASSANGVADNRGVLENLGEDKNLVFRRSNEMFIHHETKGFLPVKKATFDKMFPQYKSQMEVYIKDEKISFNDVEDVTRFVDYVHSLKMPE